MAHGAPIHRGPHADSVFRFVIEAHIPAEPVDDVIQNFLFRPEGDRYALAGEHIQVFRHMLRQVQAVRRSELRWPGPGIQQPDICDPIQPEMHNSFVVFAVANEIIPPVGGRHLVGIDDIAFHRSGFVPARMELFVRAEAVVGEGDLLAVRNGLVQNLNGIKQLRILRRGLRQRGNKSHLGLEIAVGQPLQLFYQILALAIGNMLGKEQTIDQKPQLRIRKLPLQIEVRENVAVLRCSILAGDLAQGLLEANIIAHFHQDCQVPLDALAVGVEVVLPFQNVHDVPLAQPVLRIGIVPQDLQNCKGKLFLLWFSHFSHSLFILSFLPIEYNTGWGKSTPSGA